MARIKPWGLVTGLAVLAVLCAAISALLAIAPRCGDGSPAQRLGGMLVQGCDSPRGGQR